MPSQVICPQGHRFELESGLAPICPECGAALASAGSVADCSETFKPVDELPPLPIPGPSAATSRIPFQLSGYEILEELGRGGMGVVYKALQVSLNRPVALKMILSGAVVMPEDLVRFKTEAEACGQLHHPNIVQIYEIGEREGQPYIAFEFVDGGTLDRHLAGAPAEPHVSAQLVETLARAVHFAHTHNIIHRDLKPANILMQVANGKTPMDMGSAIPKITDFGLAKRLDQDSGPTRAGSVMGTPSDMAPEQAAGAAVIGPGADVYALGAILYEMLTGRPPFRAVTPIETVRQVLQEEPVPPRRLQPGVPRDLETICLKCLNKAASQRYASADALADDLGRFLAGQPILARPTGWHERTLKWVRRRPALAGLIGASAVAALLFVGLAVGLFFNARLQDSLEETEKQRARADSLAQLNGRYDYLGRMNLAQRFWREQQVPLLLQVLERYRAAEADRHDLRNFEWHYLRRLCHGDLLTFAEHQHPVTCAAFSPTENLVASGSGKSTPAGVDGFGEVRLWDADSGRLRHLLQGHRREVNAVAFSADGKLLATASSDKTVRLCNVATGATIFVLKDHDDAVTAVAFHPAGNVLAAGCRDHKIYLWDVKTGKNVQTLERHGDAVTSLTFNPDGTRLVSGSGDSRKGDPGEIWVWDAATGKPVAGFRGHPGAVTAVAFHPDGKSFASAGDDPVIRIWNADNEKEIHALRGHQARVTCLAFDKTGARLASGSSDLTVLVWDPATGAELFSRKGHTDTVRGVAFSTDGTRLLSAGSDRTVKIWTAEGDQEYAVLSGHADHVADVVFSPDGQLLASASLDHSVRVWDVTTGKARQVLAGHTAAVRCLAFAPLDKDRKTDWQIVSGGDDGVLRFWDIAAAKEIHLHRVQAPRQQIRALAIGGDGTRLAYAGVTDGDFQKPAVITVWNLRAKKTVATLAGHSSRVSSLAFSPDGQRLVSASAGDQGGLKIWDAASGDELVSIPLVHATEPRVVFSPDGRRLAVANGDLDKGGEIRILDALTGKELRGLAGHLGMANALVFRPDGERLVATSGKLGGASQIRLWDVQTGLEALTLRGLTGLVQCLAFSPDGRRLACGGGPLLQPGPAPARGEIILWDSGPR